MNEQDFETEKYLFYIYKIQSRRNAVEREDIGSVGVNVAYLDKHTEQQIKVEEIKELLKDMGKWETVVKAGKSLLEDFGITEKSETENEEEFGYEKYTMKYSQDRKSVYVIIGLTQEESLRRSKGDYRQLKPSEKEIAEQIKNIQKWQKLRRAISEVSALR
jgi:hypothetical protein